jgi:hypothetical protein
MKPPRWFVTFCAALALTGADRFATLQADQPAAKGPLRIHPDNGRYFTDGSKSADGNFRAVYLTGSHHWNNLQDSGRIGGPLTNRFDYDDYLNRLATWNHNFIRLWGWDGPAYWYQGGQNDNYYEPLPWLRTAQENATSSGKSRFDLDQFNDAYFQRLRARVQAAREKGIYVSVMLFQGWSIYSHGYGNPWPGHPFNKENNVNGIDGDADADGEGKEVHTLKVPGVTRRQEAYIRKVVDTVNDLDNVLYEVTNETALWSKDWQYHVVRYLKDYQSTKPKQHPVGITAFDSGGAGSVDALFASPADWISPQNDGTRGDYQSDPPAADGRKVIISDTDHLWGVGGEFDWVWKSFTRGHHPIYMDPLRKEKWFTIDEEGMQGARKAMGETRRLADRLKLWALAPQPELSSTRYCLAYVGFEYVIYQPRRGEFQVTLPRRRYRVEWIHPVNGNSVPGASIDPENEPFKLNPPWDGPAAVYISRAQ